MGRSRALARADTCGVLDSVLTTVSIKAKGLSGPTWVGSCGLSGFGWAMGSKPSLILLAFWASFSQALARSCSAWMLVRCGGVGLDGVSQPLESRVLLFLLQLLRYVRILLRVLSANSGNCRAHASMIAWIFSLGCLLMGTMRSKFSSTNSRTNMLNALRRSGSYWASILSSSLSSSASSSSSSLFPLLEVSSALLAVSKGVAVAARSLPDGDAQGLLLCMSFLQRPRGCCW